jgi:pyruvate dehydrogenase E2 component (dihydrolipoamide acetyltransferase)
MSIETDALDALYATVKPKGVTMTALLAKAIGVALAQHPLLFSTLSADGTAVTYNEKVNLAVAVALDGGLITPVLADVANTDLFQVGRAWKDLVARARSKSLSSAEYSSGNFTVSNLGMFGVDVFDAILPPGQSGILAVGASKRTVVPLGEAGSLQLGVRTIMTVNLTADHRHVNGDKAAEFLQTLKEVIEHPSGLVL